MPALNRNAPQPASDEDAAVMWGKGGGAYDNVSYAISDALAHAAQRLDPREGEHILDVGTGTGWSARNAARGGARVMAIDIAPELLAAAREISAHVHPRIDFRLADAMQLPFADGEFDGVISTFGVMFVPDQQRAGRELARVCRRGGRLVIASWASEGSVAEFFGLIGSFTKAPPPVPSPLAWGDPEHVASLLGRDFDLVFEPGISRAYHASPDRVWDWYLAGFGPLKMVHEHLGPVRRTELRRAMETYHEHYRVEAGLRVDREYLLTIGRRR